MRGGVSALSERERLVFVEHIARLEQRVEELERQPPKPRPVPPVVALPKPSRRRLVFGHSTRSGGGGLGRLTFQQALDAHTPGVTTQEVADAAGVTRPSVSRWRIANGLTALWVLPEEIPDCWRQAAPGSTIAPDPIKGEAEGSQRAGRPIRQASTAHT